MYLPSLHVPSHCDYFNQEPFTQSVSRLQLLFAVYCLFTKPSVCHNIMLACFLPCNDSYYLKILVPIFKILVPIYCKLLLPAHYLLLHLQPTYRLLLLDLISIFYLTPCFEFEGEYEKYVLSHLVVAYI